MQGTKETQDQSLVGKIPWRKEWQSIPVFLSGESHVQRSLVGYSPWGHKVSDTTEQLNTAYGFRSETEGEQGNQDCIAVNKYKE